MAPPGTGNFWHMSHQLDPGERFCGTHLAWMVEAYEPYPLPKFGEVTFTDIIVGRLEHCTSIPVVFKALDIQNVNGVNITSSSMTENRKTVNINHLERFH